MTAATAATAASRPRPAACWRGRVLLRLLRLELRHNAMAGLLPVALVLFWLTTYRKDMAMPPLWNLRAAGLQLGAVLDFAVPVTGAAAWMGSREARRRVTDQVTVTARPGWARLLVPWAATTIWALTAYLGGTAVLYAVTAHQASWGGPLWWPAAVGAATLPAFSALGFVLGTLLPGRFTAPLAAIVAFFVVALSTQLIRGSQSYWNVSPVVTGPWDLGPQPGVATFYSFLPDLPIAQVMFLAGLTAALLGALALPAGSGGRALRAAAAGLAGAGLLAAGTAVGLAGTGTLDANGMIAIPALHDAASDQPRQFTPVCSRTAIPVCLNPAFASYLPVTATALAPLLSQLAGLPGAPARIVQDSVVYSQGAGNAVTIRPRSPGDSLSSPVSHLILPDQTEGQPMTAAQLASMVITTYGLQLVDRVTGDGPGASQAQHAVAAALLRAVGVDGVIVIQAPSGPCRGPAGAPPARRSGPGRECAGQSAGVARGTPAAAAAERFAAQPAQVRHAWLVRHLAALRAGQVTLAELPVTGARLVRLYAVSRRVPLAVLAIAASAVGLRIALLGHWDAYGALQLPLIFEAAAAVSVVATVAGPFGEPERVAGRWLPYLRLAATAALTAAAIGLLTAACTGASLSGGPLDVLRNVVGIIGIGLLCAAALGGGLSWTGPTGYLVAAVYALYTQWHRPALTTPWLWPARPPHDLGGAICAGLIFACGLAVVTARGARDRPGDPAAT